MSLGIDLKDLERAYRQEFQDWRYWDNLDTYMTRKMLQRNADDFQCMYAKETNKRHKPAPAPKYYG